jgi:hypothetical protein
MTLVTLQEAVAIVGMTREGFRYHVVEGRIAHLDAAGKPAPQGTRFNMGSRFSLEQVNALVSARAERTKRADERADRLAARRRAAAAKRRARDRRSAQAAARVGANKS